MPLPACRQYYAMLKIRPDTDGLSCLFQSGGHGTARELLMRLLLSCFLLILLSGCTESDSVDTRDHDTGGVTSPDQSASNGCARKSWVAGGTELCRGKLIYRDYVYDDYGADAGLISADPSILNVLTRAGHLGVPFATTPGLLSPTAGDQRYPAGRENTADLVTLTLFIDGDELVADFELNTLFHADDAIAAIAIDTDNNSATGGGAWIPLRTASRGWEVLETFTIGDPDTNRIQGRLPLPSGTVWRVQAALAQKDGTVMNVAFRGIHEEAKADGLRQQFLPGAGNFWEDRQAAVLASGDISPFGAVVSVADLRAGVTRAAPIPSGFHQRVYTSAYTLGEGISMRGQPGVNGDTGMPLCEQAFTYLGKYQPYGVYFPSAMFSDAAKTASPGVQLVMHGCEANHASQINQLNMQRQFGDDLNRILVSPLGRGPVGFYSGISERDVLDALADVESTYRTDRERVFTSGYSMGGYAAMRLAALYPDRFAGLANWVGFTGDVSNTPLPGNPLPAVFEQLGAALPAPMLRNGLGIGAAENVIDLLGNLRHVPSVNSYGALDELVQVSTALALAQRFEQVGAPYRFHLHSVAEHLSFLIFDDWRKEADATRHLVRVTRPSRVTYRFDAAFDFPEYQLRHDGAYWVSGIRPRQAGYSDVDLNAPGCGGSEWTLASAPIAGTAPVPWVGMERRITGRQPLTANTLLQGTVANVSQLLINADATCLRGKVMRYDLTSDGPAQIRFNDGRRLTLSAGRNTGSL